mgnify:CR=1 FL=1
MQQELVTTPESLRVPIVGPACSTPTRRANRRGLSIYRVEPAALAAADDRGGRQDPCRGVPGR